MGVPVGAPAGVKVTREARRRDGASGAYTSSCSTVPPKFEAGALLVGRVDARMILWRIGAPPQTVIRPVVFDAADVSLRAIGATRFSGARGSMRGEERR